MEGGGWMGEGKGGWGWEGRDKLLVITSYPSTDVNQPLSWPSQL